MFRAHAGVHRRRTPARFIQLVDEVETIMFELEPKWKIDSITPMTSDTLPGNNDQMEQPEPIRIREQQRLPSLNQILCQEVESSFQQPFNPATMQGISFEPDPPFDTELFNLSPLYDRIKNEWHRTGA
jgi:hypothetical protein